MTCCKISRPLTATVLITHVGKSPNISQVHRKANDRQKKIHLFAPFVPGVKLRDDRHRDGVIGAVTVLRGAVVGQTAGHNRWVLSGHRTVKSQSEDRLHRELDVSPGDDRAEGEELVELQRTLGDTCFWRKKKETSFESRALFQLKLPGRFRTLRSFVITDWFVVLLGSSWESFSVYRLAQRSYWLVGLDILNSFYLFVYLLK